MLIKQVFLFLFIFFSGSIYADENCPDCTEESSTTSTTGTRLRSPDTSFGDILSSLAAYNQAKAKLSTIPAGKKVSSRMKRIITKTRNPWGSAITIGTDDDDDDDDDDDTGMYMQMLLEGTEGDHKKFIEIVKANFNSLEKKQALIEGLEKLGITPEIKKDFLLEIVKGEIDQEVLNKLLTNEFQGLENQELLTLLVEHYNFDHISTITDETFFCEQIEPSFEHTKFYKKQHPHSEIPLDGIDILINQAKVLYLLSESVNTASTCLDGLTVQDKIQMLVEENIFDKTVLELTSPFLVNEIACGENPVKNVLSFCDTTDVLKFLEESLLAKSEIKKKPTKNELQIISSIDTKNCNFMMLDKNMKAQGKGLSRDITLTISPKQTSKEFTITGKTKEEFVTQLKMVLKGE